MAWMRSIGILGVVLAAALGGAASGAKAVVSSGQPVTHWKPTIHREKDGRLRVVVWAAEGAVRGRASLRVDVSSTGNLQLVDRDVALRLQTINGRRTGVGKVTLPVGVTPRGPVEVTHSWFREDGSAILSYSAPTERHQLGISIGATRTTYIRQEE